MSRDKSKIELSKGGATKLVDSDNHEVLNDLYEAGWSSGGKEPTVEKGMDEAINLSIPEETVVSLAPKLDEREQVVHDLKGLGIKHHHKLGLEKLKRLLEEAKKED